MGINKVTQIDDHTWAIEEFNGTVYGFLLEGEDYAMLIDTGLGFCNYKKYVKQLTHKPVEVVNTHGHLDHVSQNQAFRCHMHPADAAVLAEHRSHDLRLGFIKDLLKGANLPEAVLDSKLVALLFKKITDLPKTLPFLPVQDGDTFDLGGRTLQVIHVPGHTPGSIVLLDVERRWLFSGDMVCDEGVLLNFPESCSVQTFKDSMLKLKSLSDQWDTIYPAHHIKPIDNSFIDEYIACAEEVLSGQVTEEEQAAPIIMHKRGTIALAYTPDKL